MRSEPTPFRTAQMSRPRVATRSRGRPCMCRDEEEPPTPRTRHRRRSATERSRFFVAHSSFVRSETLKRFGKAVGAPRRESRATHLELVELAHGRHRHAGVLRRAGRLERFGPEMVKVGGRRGQRSAEGFRSAMGDGVAFRDFSRVTPRRARGRSGRRDAREDTYLWKVGEKRFFKSFTLEPPFFTAFAAFAALALASSVGSRARMETGGAGVSFPLRARRRAAREGASIVARRSRRGEDAEVMATGTHP